MAPNFTTLVPPDLTDDYTNFSLVLLPNLVSVRDTSAKIAWKFNGTSTSFGYPLKFEVEVAVGEISHDFQFIDEVELNSVIALPAEDLFQVENSLTALSPDQSYRLRVIPVFHQGNGIPSNALIFTTLPTPKNYWEYILPSRSSEATYHRGFSDPVLTRPHLTEGVEIYGQRAHSSPSNDTNILTSTSLWYSDPPTSEAQPYPSGRRGGSLTLIEGAVYLFGGRTNGYSCASVLKDTTNLGLYNSGFDIYSCVTKQAEVNELWLFNLETYQWKFLNTSKYQTTAPPPAREQHAAVNIDEDLFIFGGKSRLHSLNSQGFPIMTNSTDLTHGDLWRLNLQHPEAYSFSWKQPVTTIQQDTPLKAVINTNLSSASSYAYVTPREGYCIKNMSVKVQLNHPCISQLRISLLGPGPMTSSPNFFSIDTGMEVLLLTNISSNSTFCIGGNHTFLFNDGYSDDPSECCHDHFNGMFKPAGKLGEFIDNTMLSKWTLVVEDMKADKLGGYLISWELHFLAAPCFPTYTWTNLSSLAIGDKPSPRYASQVVAYQSSMFVYGGRDKYDAPLDDLYRFDLYDLKWVQLQPVGFQLPLTPYTFVDSSSVLTTWGLIEFGGLTRFPSLTLGNSVYSNSVLKMDPVTSRWQAVEIESEIDNLNGRNGPSSRYLTSMVFLPAQAVEWQTSLSERLLYNQSKRSYHVNYQGALADSILIFGGFDGAPGAAQDGSNGGYLNDLWMLRLNAFSTEESRINQRAYISKHCAWRMATGAISGGTHTCLSNVTKTACRQRDLLLLPWCAFQSFTMS
eukprot:gene3219-3524_t